MDWKQIGQQMINFQKTLFDNSYNATCIVQDQGEKIFKGYLHLYPWMSSDSQKRVNDTLAFAKTAREDFKKAVDEGYKQFNTFFAG
jgi:hypothetical protein